MLVVVGVMALLSLLITLFYLAARRAAGEVDGGCGGGGEGPFSLASDAAKQCLSASRFSAPGLPAAALPRDPSALSSASVHSAVVPTAEEMARGSVGSDAIFQLPPSASSGSLHGPPL